MSAKCSVVWVLDNSHRSYIVITLGETKDSESEIYLESHSDQAGLSKKEVTDRELLSSTERLLWIN